MPTFRFQTPHTVTRADGKRVAVTIPVDFPPRLLAHDLLYTYDRQGYRHDGTPAGYYRADDGSDLWLCDGTAHDV